MISTEGLCGFSKVLLVDVFIPQAPDRSEFVYINSLSAFVAISRALGQGFEYLEMIALNTGPLDLDRLAIHFNWIFIIGGLLVGYLNIRSVEQDKKTLKSSLHLTGTDQSTNKLRLTAEVSM